jgi:hypothetical protein
MSENAFEPITTDFLVAGLQVLADCRSSNCFEDSRVLPDNRLHPKTVIPYSNMS